MYLVYLINNGNREVSVYPAKQYVKEFGYMQAMYNNLRL